MPARMIVVDGLLKTFGWRRRTTAVDDVSFSVDEGHIFGLLGPKDAGKTTIARILATTLRPSAGSATIGGYDVVEQARQARGILGFMPETIEFSDWGSGRAFLRFWSRVAGLAGGKANARIDELNEMLEVSDALSEDPSEYTVEVKKRLALAQALILDPEVLLLDEPVTGIAGTDRDFMLRQLGRLKNRGKTILMTSPFLTDVQPISDHVSIIVGGRSTRAYEMNDLLGRVGEGRHARIFVKTEDRSAASLASLKGLEGVNDVRSTHTATVVYVDPGKIGASDIEEALSTEGVKVEYVREAEITLGDVFRALYEEEA